MFIKEQELRLVEQPLGDEIPSDAIARNEMSPAKMSLSSIKLADDVTLKMDMFPVMSYLSEMEKSFIVSVVPVSLKTSSPIPVVRRGMNVVSCLSEKGMIVTFPELKDTVGTSLE